jgi:hypothetical protein
MSDFETRNYRPKGEKKYADEEICELNGWGPGDVIVNEHGDKATIHSIRYMEFKNPNTGEVMTRSFQGVFVLWAPSGGPARTTPGCLSLTCSSWKKQ